MAQSPFQTSGNVADIAPVQLKGGFTPDTGIADALVDVANTVLPVIRQNREDSLTEDVSGKIQAVSLALKATRFPSIQSSVFSEEALANPNVALALKEFTLIQDATKTGRLPSTFALERLELIQNNAIRNAPEFEAEIRGAMRDATGQDPQKALFSQLLSESTSKTAEQKAFEQLDVEAIKLGINRDQLIQMNQVAAQNKIQQNKYDLASKQGEYTLNTAGSEVVNRGANLVTDVMANVQSMLTSGQSIGVDEKLALTTQVNAAFGAANAAILAKTSGLNVSGADINAELVPLNELRESTLKMIEDGTLQNMLTQHNKTIIADTQNTFMNNAEYGKLYQVLGAEGTLDFMEFKAKYGNNPQTLALAKVLNPGAGSIMEVDGILKQASMVGDGAELTGGDRQARILAAGNGVSNTGAGEEYQMKALRDIENYGGQELAWSSFGSNKVLTATAKSTQLKAAFLNMQVATTAGLSTDLLQLANTANVQLDRLVLGNDGNLTITPRSQAESVGLAATARDADASMQTYVRRFNRANSISAKYFGAGILPPTRYQGAQHYWDTVKSAATESLVPKEKADAPRKVIIDSAGNLVFATGGE